MMVAVECARIAVLYGAWAAASDAPDASSAAAMAKASASEAYRHVTARAIQVHGGGGFTWEHDLHLYCRRALSTDVMFGDAAWNRERIAQRLRL
jgi:alkylation response protein AidB-like acyl-CoA dehydrogenase